MKTTLDQSIAKMDALLRQAASLIGALSDVLASAGQSPMEEPPAVESSYAKARKRYPNTGKPWSAEADQELRKLFESGNSIEDLSIYFQRSENGVRARLVKFGLLESDQFRPRFAA